MDGPEISPNQRDFFRIVRAATAIAFGVTGGVLAGLAHSGSGIVLKFNFWVIPAVAAGAAVGWAYWSFILRRLIAPQSRQVSKRFRVYTVLLVIGGLICFFYPIRYAIKGNISDVLEGILMAFFIVGIVGWLVWSVARLLNRQDSDQTKPR
jgi:hypothetical protein